MIFVYILMGLMPGPMIAMMADIMVEEHWTLDGNERLAIGTVVTFLWPSAIIFSLSYGMWLIARKVLKGFRSLYLRHKGVEIPSARVVSR